MATTEARPTLFLRDFTDQGGDRFFWLIDDSLLETTIDEIVDHEGALLFHDFWLVRDAFFHKRQILPAFVIDLDELRISISGNPEDRIERDKCDIADELSKYGTDPEICAKYRQVFYRGVAFDEDVALHVARGMAAMYSGLCQQAAENGESDRFFELEVPVYQLLQGAMAAGLRVDVKKLSDMRREAEHDYFLCLKEYSDKHDMPLETPQDHEIEARLIEDGYNLSGVSVEYMLEFVPHQRDFGNDTIGLQRLDAARRVLSALTLSTDRVRPIVDVFGSRTSRVHLRNPPLQNISKKYRSLIIPSKGSQLSYVDFDQYEVGIMAALSGDPELAELYAAGDMYEIFSSRHLGLEGNRRAAKQLFLSYAYGMSRPALVDAAVALGASRDRAKAAFRVFSRYEDWKKSIAAAFQREGRIGTTMGNNYSRPNTGTLTAKERRSAVSQVVQGTASLIFKKAVLGVAELPGVIIVLPMHDALLFEYSKSDAPAAVVKVFEKVMTDHFGGLIAGKASIGHFVEG